jgi:hypothetical protein
VTCEGSGSVSRDQFRGETATRGERERLYARRKSGRLRTGGDVCSLACEKA